MSLFRWLEFYEHEPLNETSTNMSENNSLTSSDDSSSENGSRVNINLEVAGEE